MKKNIFLMILMMIFSYASEMNNLQQLQKTAEKTQTSSDNTFETEHPYANNEEITKEICTVDAGGNHAPFTVRIYGEVEESYDFITVAGIKFTGRVHKTFKVKNPCVKVHFTSDGSVARHGVIVTIGDTIFKTENPYANKENIKTKLCSDAPTKGFIHRVSIKGEVEEGYDFITVDGRKFTGVIDENFMVKSHCANVSFTSDSSITKEGVELKITPYQP